MLMLLSALGSTADNFLMPQLNFLARLFRLSPDVAGVTLSARMCIVRVLRSRPYVPRRESASFQKHHFPG